MTKANFYNLTIQERGEYVFKNGTYLTDRIYYLNKYVLYSIDRNFIEVGIDPDTLEIFIIDWASLDRVEKFYGLKMPS